MLCAARRSVAVFALALVPPCCAALSLGASATMSGGALLARAAVQRALPVADPSIAP